LHHLAWPALATIGILLYELTAQPAVGAVAICIKLGWDDFRTARWLRRMDPDTGRGKACFWAYLAAGFWKVAGLAAIVMVLIGLFADAVFQQKRRVPLAGGQNVAQILTAVGLEALAGFALCCVASCIAFWHAWCEGIKLWISSGVRKARRFGIFPPLLVGSREWNTAGRLIVTTVIAFGIFAAVALTFVCIGFLRNGPGGGGEVAVPVLGFTITLGIPAVCLWTRDVLKKRLVADSPYQCW
jgi:hypothetical protein